jgi:hypothetical protein
MGITAAGTLVHWNYFLAIERDLEVLSRYIEFDERNFQCFSIENARIILAAGAESDIVCKKLCRLADVNSRANKINHYRTNLVAAIPGIADFEVTVARFGLTLKPWDEWRNAGGVPFWWTAYNKVKHHRDTDFDKANLKNALNAVAGLFILVLYLYESFARWGISPSAQLFSTNGLHDGGVNSDGNHVYLVEPIQLRNSSTNDGNS